jgi:hypothetical protein
MSVMVMMMTTTTRPFESPPQEVHLLLLLLLLLRRSLPLQQRQSSPRAERTNRDYRSDPFLLRRARRRG